MEKEKKNKHEMAESKPFERNEQKMKTEPEYRSDKQDYKKSMKKNYKGNNC